MSTQITDNTGLTPLWLLQKLAEHLVLLVTDQPEDSHARCSLRQVALSLGSAIYQHARAASSPYGSPSLIQLHALFTRLGELWEHPVQIESTQHAQIVFRATHYPFDQLTTQTPNISRLQLATYAAIAARHFGYARMVVEADAADADYCRVYLYLRPVSVADSRPGDEFRREDVNAPLPLPHEDIRDAAPELAMLRQDFQALQRQHAELAARLAHVVELERKANEELQSVTQIKRDFLSNVSHELRTPLTVMRGYLGLLGQGMWGSLNSDQQEALEVAQRNLLRLQQMITDLLDLSSVSGGQMLLAGEPLKIAGVLRQAMQRAATSAEEKHIQLRLRIAEEAGSVVGDREKLTQLFTHLLDNAVKFSDAGTEVLLSVRRSQQQLLVEVIDHGIGMTQEQLAHVFLPFVQGESGLTRHYGGLGTGLSLIHNLVTLHGGDVSLLQYTRPGHHRHHQPAVARRGIRDYYLASVNSQRSLGWWSK